MSGKYDGNSINDYDDGADLIDGNDGNVIAIACVSSPSYYGAT